MKLLTLLLLPALLCTVTTQSGATVILNRTHKTAFYVSSGPIFPVVNSTKLIAVSGSAIYFNRTGVATISGLVDVGSWNNSNYLIERDSTCTPKKNITNTSTAVTTAYFNAANSNLSSATGLITRKASDNSLSDATVVSGITTFDKGLTITDGLTFLNQSDPAAIFIVKVTGDLTIGPGATLAMEDESSSFKNVYFQVTGKTTIGSGAFAPAQFVSTGAIVLKNGAQSGILCTPTTVTLGANVSVNTLFDTDGDTVPDDQDDFPNQILKANNNLIASQTIAYEDLWPATGDFDMNDLVMSFDYNLITDANGYLTEVIGNYQLLATGGILHNGFGIEFPFLAPGDLQMCIEPSPTIKRGIQEPGQKNAVVLLFTDMRKEMYDWNTLEDAIHFSAPTLYTVSFRVTKKILLSSIKTDGFNPFIYRVKGTSRSEVHLSGRQPTNLADQSLFHTVNDNTSPGTATTYVSKTGLPFAIMLPTSSSPFEYPKEVKDICATYLHFSSWATSGGTIFKDWFSNKASEYRNNNIYIIPTTITN